MSIWWSSCVAMCAADVVVEVATHSQVAVQGPLMGELFSSPESDPASSSVAGHDQPPPTRVREPPQPRLPTMSAAGGSEVRGHVLSYSDITSCAMCRSSSWPPVPRLRQPGQGGVAGGAVKWVLFLPPKWADHLPKWTHHLPPKWVHPHRYVTTSSGMLPCHG